MIRVAAVHGYDLGRHRARQVSRDDLVWADVVLAMDRWTLDRVKGLSVTCRAEIRLFLADGTDVPDPFGQPLAAYALAFSAIQEGARQFVAERLDRL